MTTIRNARNHDAPALAGLCAELGYPATRRQVVARLATIEAQAASRVLVAEDAEGVVGWIHVAMQAQLLGDDEAEILGLVIAESARGAGIGAALLRAAEAWATGRGAARMRVRSRVERDRAHRFYRRAGYEHAKSQHVFARPLGA